MVYLFPNTMVFYHGSVVSKQHYIFSWFPLGISGYFIIVYHGLLVSKHDGIRWYNFMRACSGFVHRQLGYDMLTVNIGRFVLALEYTKVLDRKHPSVLCSNRLGIYVDRSIEFPLRNTNKHLLTYQPLMVVSA